MARSPVATPERASRWTVWSGRSSSSRAGPTASPFPSRSGSFRRPRPTIALVNIVNEVQADVRASFWERMIPMRSDPEARPLVALHLIEHGRAWAALGVLI